MELSLALEQPRYSRELSAIMLTFSAQRSNDPHRKERLSHWGAFALDAVSALSVSVLTKFAKKPSCWVKKD
jgi:hypothetical protein